MIEILRPYTCGAYDFPRLCGRREPASIAVVIHITSNARSDATGEVAYANRCRHWAIPDGETRVCGLCGRTSTGPDYGTTCTVDVDRDGTRIRTLDPRAHCAWTSGDVDMPNRAMPGVQRILALLARGRNANEAVFEQIEVCCGAGEEWTAAQFESVAEVTAAACRALGVQPVRGDTVLGHCDIDGRNRPSDPWPAAVREANFARLIERARELMEGEGSDVAGRNGRLTGRRAHLKVKSDAPHYGVPMDGRPSSVAPWPKLTPGAEYPDAPEIVLAEAVPGGAAGADRKTAFLSNVGAPLCAILASDVVATFESDAAVAKELDSIAAAVGRARLAL